MNSVPPKADADLWIGLDVGTQSVKAVVVDDAGSIHGTGSHPLSSDRHGARHEQDPSHWIRAAANALREALAGLTRDDKKRIRALATCATSGTIAIVDDSGVPVGTGLMYDDARAAALAQEAQDADPGLWHRLGYRIQPTWALPKMLWLQRHGELSPGRFLAHQSDVVVGGIVGDRPATDWSHSLKSGLDLLAGTWPDAVLDRLGLSRNLLPDVVRPGTRLGYSTPAWDDLTGLPSGTPVIAGMTDGCAAQISAGTLDVGDWHTVIGTTLVVKTVADHLVRDDRAGLYSHRSPVDGRWFPGGASSVGAGALSTLFAATDLVQATRRVRERFDQDLAGIPVSYPLTGRGERFPLTRPDAVGYVDLDGVRIPLEGAARPVDADSLFASVLLGIACVERLSVETLARAGSPVTGNVSSSGGGTNNPWWVQLRADVLERPMAVPASSEGSLGMAILAAWSADPRQELSEVAARLTSPPSVVHPGPERGAVAAYERFIDSVERAGWSTT